MCRYEVKPLSEGHFPDHDCPNIICDANELLLVQLPHQVDETEQSYMMRELIDLADDKGQNDENRPAN